MVGSPFGSASVNTAVAGGRISRRSRPTGTDSHGQVLRSRCRHHRALPDRVERSSLGVPWVVDGQLPGKVVCLVR